MSRPGVSLKKGIVQTDYLMVNIGIRRREFTLYLKVTFEEIQSKPFEKCVYCGQDAGSQLNVEITEMQEGGRSLIPQDDIAFEAVKKIQKELFHETCVCGSRDDVMAFTPTRCQGRISRRMENKVLRHGNSERIPMGFVDG